MKNKSFSQFMQQYMMYIVLVALVLFFAVVTPALGKGSFLNAQNIINVIGQNVYLLVVGVGITFIMLSGAMDLSIGYQISTVCVVMGLMARSGISSLLIILVGLIMGVVLGMVNGAIYARLKVFPFIITLATQYILYGASFLLSGSKTFRDFDSAFKFLGGYSIRLGKITFPISILVMIVIVLIGAFILNKTYFGRNIYALGSNPDAVALSGVSVAKMRVMVFAVAGIFVALGAIMQAGRIGAASSNTGVGAEFTVMAGAMLGGIKMGGGGGKMNNMVVGMLIIGLLNNGMNILNMSKEWQNVALGIILLLAITIDTLQTESAMKKAKRVTGVAPSPEPVENVERK